MSKIGDQDGGMARDDFYKLAMEPNFPNEMAFELETTKQDRGLTFSREGFEGVVDQIDSFIMARTLANWRRTGSPPKHMRINVSLDFGPEDDVTLGDRPYFKLLDDRGGLTQVDGERRKPRH